MIKRVEFLEGKESPRRIVKYYVFGVKIYESQRIWKDRDWFIKIQTSIE